MCRKCGQRKPAESFPFHYRKLNQRSTRCSECTAAYLAEYHARRTPPSMAPEAIAEERRRDAYRKALRTMDDEDLRIGLNCEEPGSFESHEIIAEMRRRADKQPVDSADKAERVADAGQVKGLLCETCAHVAHCSPGGVVGCAMYRPRVVTDSDAALEEALDKERIRQAARDDSILDAALYGPARWPAIQFVSAGTTVGTWRGGDSSVVAQRLDEANAAIVEEHQKQLRARYESGPGLAAWPAPPPPEPLLYRAPRYCEHCGHARGCMCPRVKPKREPRVWHYDGRARNRM